MKLGRKLIGPQLLLLALVTSMSVAQLFYLTGERRTLGEVAKRLQRTSAQIQHLSQVFADAERALLSYRIRPDEVLSRRVLEAVAETEDTLRLLDLGEWTPRGQSLLGELNSAYRLMVGLQAQLIASIARGDEAAMQGLYVRWWFVAEKANAMLADLSAYNVRRLDHSLETLHSTHLRYQAVIAALMVSAAIAALLFWIYVARQVVSPLVRLTQLAKDVGAERGAGPLPTFPVQDDEIGMLAASFSEMTLRLTAANAQLSQALASREQFLSIAAHELKTPITSLTLQLQLFKKRFPPDGDPRAVRELLNKLTEQTERQVGRLTGLVDELLDVSRIQAGKLELHLEVVKVDELVRSVVERFAPLLERSRNALEIELPRGLLCRCDPVRIDQVLVNLLSNAVKYAPGQPILIRARAADGQVQLEVRDNGPGIPEGLREEIFDRYVRGTSTASGLGLGLFICRQIVAGHGGRIWVEGGPGRGASFLVELPGALQTPLAASPAQA